MNFGYVLLYLWVGLNISSCNNDDNNAQDDTTSFTLRLKTNPFGGASTEYPSEAIIWKIDFDKQRIEVILKDDSTPVYLEQGTYSYQLIDHPCNYGENQFLRVDNQDIGLMILDDLASGTLIITGECYDGDRLTFQKIE